MNDFRDLVNALSGGKLSIDNAADANDALERLRSTLATSSSTFEDRQARLKFRMDSARAGFVDCDDGDARIVLALLDAFEKYFELIYQGDENSLPMINGSVQEIVNLLSDTASDFLTKAHILSGVRCSALGRKMPVWREYMPKEDTRSKPSGSNVSFMPPYGEAG